MNQLISALLKSDLFWQIPAFFSATIFLAAAYFYFPKPEEGSVKKFKILVWIILGAKIFYSVFLSFFQYYVWKNSEFTNLFLNSSADPRSYPKLGFLTAPFAGKLGYFTLYVIERFWLGALISIFIACAFYLFLKVLRKHKERFFEEGEAELGFAMALLVGWPGFVIFLGLIFVFVLIISVFKMIFLKEHLTTLGLPFLLSALCVLIWGSALVQFFNLGVLKI